MARSSRHKSHRSHKHRDRSDSEDEGSSRDRKQRVEEEEAARVSRVSEQEKRKASSKDGVGTSNGEISGENVKKRKDRGEDSGIGGDRWNGGGDDDARAEKESKREGSEGADYEKSSKLKPSNVDSKGKSSSSRRREGSSERNDEKRRSEKDSSRRESGGSQHKDGKEKEKERERVPEKERERVPEKERERERGSEKERDRERGSEKEKEKDKKGHESRHERSDDGAGRREERYVKQGVEISEIHDEMRNPEAEKELDKRIKRRRDGSDDHDKVDDAREGDDRHISSRDGHSKSGNYKDGRYKEKHREELDKDQRHYDEKRRDDDKRRDERSSRTHNGERSDNKYYRDDTRASESRDKKTKPQDGDRDSSRRGDDNSAKIKDNRGRKRSSDEIEEQNDMKSRSAKEPREDTAKNVSSSGKPDSRSDRARLEHSHIDKVDSGLSSSRTKNSPNAGAYAGKDHNRYNSRQAESTRRDSASEDTRRRDSEDARRRDSASEDARRRDSASEDARRRDSASEDARRRDSASEDARRRDSASEDARRRDLVSEDARRSGASSRDHAVAPGGRERVSDSRSSEKAKMKDNVRSDAFTIDAGPLHHHDRIPKSDARTSPNQLREKSPSTSERRTERITLRRNLDVEEVGQRNSSKSGKGDASFQKDNGRERDYHAHKPNEDDIPQGEFLRREPLGLSSSSRIGQLQGGSPAHLPPPPPVRYGLDSPSVLGSYEDEIRIQNERKTNNRYKRDSSVVRVPGTPWKNAPTWPSPLQNGFMPPLHPGHPGGFHPGVPPFSTPPLFGLRPSMDLNNSPYHIHEPGNRFPGHVRPYGWHNPVDDCPPHLQVWDVNTNMFGDESHIYGRQEWDQNRHMVSNRAWEMSTDMWPGPNGNVNLEFPASQKEHEYSRQTQADETWVGPPGHNTRDERATSEQPLADSAGIRLPSEISPGKQTSGAASKFCPDKIPEPSKMSSVNGTSEKQNDYNVLYCTSYLSKLDISVDLVQPELYRQCMSLMAAGDVTVNFLHQGQRKNNVDGLRLVAKSKQFAHNSPSPAATDATFQRALSLYRKQTEGMKQAMHSASASVCSKQNNPPEESTDGEKVNGKATNDNGEGMLPAEIAASGDYMEEERNPVNINIEDECERETGSCEEKRCDEPGDNAKAPQIENSSDAKGNGCDKISDAVISVEGSEESEAIIPECRVNLSRIHLSPESTH